MTINKLLPALLFALPAVVNAGDFSLNSLRAGALAAAEVPAPVTAAGPVQPKKKWTIIALINGKNNLSEEVEADFNEMETVGSTADFNIVAEMGTMKEKAGEKPSYSVKRYLVKKDSDRKAVTSPALMTLKGADLGSWEHLAEFVLWAKAKYPAERYMLVVSNHGSGWKSFGKPLAPLPADKGISYDDETGNHITAIEMAAALEKSGYSDVFVTDACLMQEAATNYEMRKYANVIVGSEETEPGAGQDYSLFLPALAAAVNPGPDEVARLFVKAFADSYAAVPNEHTTISAVRAAAFDGLAPRLSALADALLATGDIQFGKDARRKTMKFADPDARDLGQFAKIVAQDTKVPAVREAALALEEYLRTEVVIAKGYTGGYAEATGLAVYLPVVYIESDGYDQLAFAKASSWTKFIKAIKSTQQDADYWDDYPED